MKTLFCVLAVLALARISAFDGPQWSAQVSTSTPASFFSVGTYSSADAFVRLQLPNGRVSPTSQATIVTITVTNTVTNYVPAAVTMSNGIGYATLTAHSNDWCNFCCRAGTNSIQWRFTITHGCRFRTSVTQ